MGNLDQVLQSNGVITDYAYDTMNRLQSLTHYGPDETPGDLSDNPVLERFEYTVDDAGNRTSETQTDSGGHTNAYQWVYDAIGRMVQESLDAYDDSLDYTADYAFDPVGNRLEKSVDTDGDGTADEVTDFRGNSQVLGTGQERPVQ